MTIIKSVRTREEQQKASQKTFTFAYVHSERISCCKQVSFLWLALVGLSA